MLIFEEEEDWFIEGKDHITVSTPVGIEINNYRQEDRRDHTKEMTSNSKNGHSPPIELYSQEERVENGKG